MEEVDNTNIYIYIRETGIMKNAWETEDQEYT